MDIPGFSGLDDQGRPHALANACQVVVDCADRQQHRNGDPLAGGAAVGENQDIPIRLNGRFRFQAKGVKAGFHPTASGVRRPCAIQNNGRKTLLIKVFDFLQLVLEEDRTVQADGIAVLGRFYQQVAFGPQSGAQ